jgi:maleylacetate reductase
VPDIPDFTYQALPGRVVFGVGASRHRLAAEVDRIGGRRVLLVMGRREAARSDALLAPLQDRVVATFSAVQEHVPIEVARAARELAHGSGADALVAIGGGSTIGTAKAIALTTGLPVLAVPTTFAGSEMTPVWGLTQDGRKTTGSDPVVLPRAVVYDPELTMTMPAHLAVASGLNALAHSVEAFWAPGRNPVSSLSAAESIGALARGLPAVRDGQDLAARTQVLYGAYLAGSAFAVAGSGLHHKICHVLGGAYRLPHAQTHAVVLPYVLAVNGPAAPHAAQRIATALGIGIGTASDVRTASRIDTAPDTPPSPGLHGNPARTAVERLLALNRAIDAPRSLDQVGLPRSSLEEAAAMIAEVVPTDNPRRLALPDVRELLEAAWEGRDPSIGMESIGMESIGMETQIGMERNH